MFFVKTRSAFSLVMGVYCFGIAYAEMNRPKDVPPKDAE